MSCAIDQFWKDTDHQAVCNSPVPPAAKAYLDQQNAIASQTYNLVDTSNPLAGAKQTFMVNHWLIDGMMLAGGSSCYRDYARGKWEYTVPVGKLIVGLKGKTLKQQGNINGIDDSWNLLYTISHVYTCDAKDICSPVPVATKVSPVAWDNPPNIKGSIQTFDIAFTDLYAGFFLCGFWVEVNGQFTGVIAPGLCMFPCTTYIGMIIRHYATGEERLYDVCGTRMCGQQYFSRPNKIKTQDPYMAIGYLSMDITSITCLDWNWSEALKKDVSTPFTVPLAVIPTVGNRYMKPWFPIPPKGISPPTISKALTANGCTPETEFNPYQAIPLCADVSAPFVPPPPMGPPYPTIGEWSAWSQCDPVTKMRNRYAWAKNSETNYTYGTDTEPCPIDGGWSTWTGWGLCDPTTKLQTRSRACNNPTPMYGGAGCIGNAVESQACVPVIITPVDTGGSTGSTTGSTTADPVINPPVIPTTTPTVTPTPSAMVINGGWSAWSDWGACDAKTNTQDKTRTCTNPAPANGGKNCIGGTTLTQSCSSGTSGTTPIQPTNTVPTPGSIGISPTPDPSTSTNAPATNIPSVATDTTSLTPMQKISVWAKANPTAFIFVLVAVVVIFYSVLIGDPIDDLFGDDVPSKPTTSSTQQDDSWF
jgi:hypothetical protein